VARWIAALRVGRPNKRSLADVTMSMGTMSDVANAAEYLASDLSAFVSGQHLMVSGGAPA
jgi:NAD(P)-dependent dehydrogenase (short-subunit alcohol dehydrogenase family)